MSHKLQLTKSDVNKFRIQHVKHFTRFQVADWQRSTATQFMSCRTTNCLPMWHLWPVLSILLRLCAGMAPDTGRHGRKMPEACCGFGWITLRSWTNLNQFQSQFSGGSTPTASGIGLFALIVRSTRPGKQWVIVHTNIPHSHQLRVPPIDIRTFGDNSPKSVAQAHLPSIVLLIDPSLKALASFFTVLSCVSAHLRVRFASDHNLAIFPLKVSKLDLQLPNPITIWLFNSLPWKITSFNR